MGDSFSFEDAKMDDGGSFSFEEAKLEDTPSRFGSVFRGALQRGGELLESAGEVAYNISLAPGARRGINLDLDAETRGATGRIADAVGAREATDDLGRALETSGEYLTDAALTLPLVLSGAGMIGLSPAVAGTAEMVAAGAGGLADGFLREKGHEGAGLAAGIGLSMMAAPVAAPITTAKRAGSAAVRAIRNMTKEAAPYVTKLGVTKTSLARASSEIKREVPDVPAMIEALRDAERSTGGLPGGVSSRQVAESLPNSRGGAGFSHMDESLSRTDKEYRRNASLRRADFLDYLGKEWDELSSVDPDFPEFLARYDEGQEALKLEERAAWKLVREGERPVFDITALKAKAQKIVDSTVYKSDDIPAVIHKLLDEDLTPGTTLDLDKMQELRSVLLGVVRDAKMKPESAKKHAAAMSMRLLNEINDALRHFEASDLTGKSLEYARARHLTAQNASLYDPSSTIINSLEKGGTPKSLFSRLRSAQGRRGARMTPAGEAKRLMRVAEQTPGGVKNIRSLAIEDLFFDGLNPIATRTPIKTLKNNEDLYRVVLGDDYDKAIELLELSRLGSAGKAGTSAQAASVGSGVSPAKFLFGMARASAEPISAAVEGAMKLAAGKVSKADLQWQAIVREALKEPKFMRILLEMPTEASLPAWKIQWLQLLARAAGRSGGRAVARGVSGEGGTR